MTSTANISAHGLIRQLIFNHAISGRDGDNMKITVVGWERDAYYKTIVRDTNLNIRKGDPSGIQDNIDLRLSLHMTFLMNSFISALGYENVLFIPSKTFVHVNLNQLPVMKNWCRSDYNLDVAVNPERDKRYTNFKNISYAVPDSEPRMDSKSWSLNTDKKYDAIVLSSINSWNNPKYNRSISYIKNLRNAFSRYGTEDFDLIDFNQYNKVPHSKRVVRGKADTKKLEDTVSMMKTLFADSITGELYRKEQNEFYDEFIKYTRVY